MRTNPDIRLELDLWTSGMKYVAGLDEAGRGALAGPVAVGAIILPCPTAPLREMQTAGQDSGIPAALAGVRDSKQMTPAERATRAPRIKDQALCWAVGFASAAEIDSDGIVAATRLAAMRAIEQLFVFPEYLLTDFRLELPELDIPQTALVKGDARCLSIAAASVLAKTARDALMCEMELQMPGYGLARHKGYGTRAHVHAIRQIGYSPVHRKSFTIKSLS
ncbi:MAG TPA: ribonuclease HII [Anaerolineales bacterium]|nr:ribonuclease HII [Anaerolineales bacterium]